MNGSNHREESDRRPLWLCPECMAKVCWATDSNPVMRFKNLAQFCEKHNFQNEKEFYERLINILLEKESSYDDCFIRTKFR